MSGALVPTILLFFFILFTGSLHAQDWRQLHKEGKKAYTEGKYQEAYDHFVNAQRIAPEDIDLSKDIGTAAYRKGEFDKAETIFSNSTGSENKDLDAKKWHNIGNSQMKQKNYAEAIESYKKSLRLNPNNRETRYNYAEAKRRLELQQDQQDNKDQNDGDNQDGDNQDSPQDQQNQNDQGDQNKENDQNKDNQQKDQSSDSSKSDSKKQDANQMNDKAADKMLEELLKKEMETKRKVQGYNKGESDKNKSGKKW
jgi:tetratricopeptide (TPR) repeat protein